ncbi:hypothetical protein LXD69_03090 [Flavobacterium sediminilitoris]|uniref:Bacteriocin-like protein n=1 Tax=Flavobacterium sediminilitoris TaxID=2024526 RepID=A0ABY4HRV6_9FLAO|nr:MULTISPECIES: hypothetical protein [Flavobacterium]UOX34504.1 hypothetical protein LXD69_03090 [Flavobacterium sediminilitoris]
MKQSILTLSGAQELSKNEQKSIKGGLYNCDVNGDKVCEQVGRHCAQLYCRFIEIEPLF